MNKDEKSEVAKLLLVMAENFNQELSQARASFLLGELENLGFEDVKAGLTRIIRTSKFFPSLAGILEAIGVRPETSSEAIKASADRQWLKLLSMSDGPKYHRVIKSYNQETGEVKYEDPTEVLDPAAKQAYHAMGDTKAGWTNENLDWKRKAFMELYERFAQHGALQIEGPNTEMRQLAEKVGKDIE